MLFSGDGPRDHEGRNFGFPAHMRDGLPGSARQNPEKVPENVVSCVLPFENGRADGPLDTGRPFTASIVVMPDGIGGVLGAIRQPDYVLPDASKHCPSFREKLVNRARARQFPAPRFRRRVNNDYRRGRKHMITSSGFLRRRY